MLVLDTDSEIRRLLTETTEFDYIVPSAIAYNVLDAIMYEKHAELELQLACMDLVKRELGSMHEEAHIKLARLIHAFGASVYEKLKYLRAYQNGYLYYHFHDFIGNDLVLGRITVDNINPNL